MSNSSSGSIFFQAVKMLIVALIRIMIIVFAWLCRIVGMILSKIGEGIEKAITK